MDAFKVAEEGWLEARIGKRVVVPGLMNKLSAQMPRIAPRAITAKLTGYIMGKA
jgi:short-subunit dehydrogenase